MTGVVLADVDGAGGIGRRRIRIRVATFGRSTFSRSHNLPIGTDRCRCWHFALPIGHGVAPANVSRHQQHVMMMISFVTRPRKTRTWHLARTLLSLFRLCFFFTAHDTLVQALLCCDFVFLRNETFGAKQSARRPQPHRTGSFKETEGPLAATLSKRAPPRGRRGLEETSPCAKLSIYRSSGAERKTKKKKKNIFFLSQEIPESDAKHTLYNSTTTLVFFFFSFYKG